MRKGFIIHLILETLLLILFIITTLKVNTCDQYYFHIKAAISILYVVLSAINIFAFIRKLYIPLSNLERTINVLIQTQSFNKEKSASDIQMDYSHYNLIDVLKLLLKRESTAALMKKQAEINALQSQINPHFLYNTLEMIRGQAICCGAIEIAETTKALADIFRYSISKKGEMIYLWEELENINSYMRIQQLRFNNKFSLNTEIEPDTMNLKLPKLLIQPVVENALKHGLEIKRGKGHITIRAFRTAGKVEISVEDDGLGMSIEKLAELNEKLFKKDNSLVSESNNNSNSIGLVNINERIKLIYGPKYGVSILSSPDVGTKVILTLGIIV